MRAVVRIIAVNRFYRPDHSATSQLLGDLAEHLANEGHDVTVVTSRQRYDGGSRLPKREAIAGVDVRRIATTNYGRANLFGRAIDYLTFYVSVFFALLSLGKRGDLLIIKTDPPLVCVPAGVAARFRRMTTVNWCQDLFPEIAVSLGMRWASGWVGRVCRWARNRALRRARFNAVLHDKMAEHLVGEGIQASQIVVLPNWPDAGIRPAPRDDNTLRREWGLGARFVIGYSGNLGRAHMPAAIADLVRQTRDNADLTWLFTGGGVGMQALRDALGGQSNVIFKPYQPQARLGESLSVADIHLISLDPGCEGVIVPSKLYGVRAVNRPVLFLGHPDGAVAREIAGHKAGWTLDAGAPGDWAKEVEALARRHPEGRGLACGSDWMRGWSSEAALLNWTRAVQVMDGATARAGECIAESASAA